MDIVRAVTDFFTGLFRQRVNAAQSKVKSKVADAGVRARSKASGAANKKIDGALDKAKSKVTKKDKT
jgi:hypothetical protein